MPMSEAALDGIRDNGLRWKHEINFAGQAERLGNEEDLVVGDCAAIRDYMVRVGRVWAARLPPHAKDLRDEALTAFDELEMCDDDIDELRLGLCELYDCFDYHRVCVVAW